MEYLSDGSSLLSKRGLPFYVALKAVTRAIRIACLSLFVAVHPEPVTRQNRKPGDHLLAHLRGAKQHCSHTCCCHHSGLPAEELSQKGEGTDERQKGVEDVTKSGMAKNEFGKNGKERERNVFECL